LRNPKRRCLLYGTFSELRAFGSCLCGRRRFVAHRTAEKDQLIREINHRVGNQLQIIRSMISVETRRADGDEALALLGRLSAELNKMADEHIRRSQADYLRYGMEASGGTVEAAVNRQGAVAQIS